MSTLVVKVCESCGEQFHQNGAWLVVDSLNIRLGRDQTPLVHIDEDMDFCSPGCLLRYLSRTVESSISHRHTIVPVSEEPRIAAAGK